MNIMKKRKAGERAKATEAISLRWQFSMVGNRKTTIH